MRRPALVVTTAGAVLAAGLITVPALAATGTGSTSSGSTSGTAATCPVTGLQIGAQAGARRGMGPMGNVAGGYGMGAGMGVGMGMNGRTGTDPLAGLAGLAQGTLTADQKQTLTGMAEEEKLAHDVYVALAKTTGDARFTRIATAETRHLTEVRALLTRYGITDPTAGKADGVFASSTVQQQYTDLAARGSASLDAALTVGRDIENADIADLARARTGVAAPDVLAVYTRLTAGSQMHLRAFGG